MTIRTLLLLISLVAALPAAKPTDYSTDMVMIEGGQVMQTLKLNVSGQKSRLEGFTIGPLGKVVTISRKDRGVTWMLFVDKRQYTEQAIRPGSQAGKPDLANLDLATVKKEYLGRENVLGHSCTKMRVTFGNLPNGRPLVGTVWIADRLELPVKLEAMGITQENRDLVVAPQAARLFEIPPGFAKTSAPGGQAGVGAGNLPSQIAEMLGAGAARYGGKTGASSTAVVSTSTSQGDGSQASRYRLERNVNRGGSDYRDFAPARGEAVLCAEACAGDSRCRSWTWVKAELEGPTGRCWLKNRVPEPAADDCCFSGVKGATVSSGSTSTGQEGGSEASRYRLERNVNRGGSDYRDFAPARGEAVLCAQACAGDPRCRSWTWVKAELEGPTGRCWLKNAVPEPAADDCCFSGVKGPTVSGGSTSTGQGGPRYRLEQNVNRNGSDFSDFAPARADAVACAEACSGDSRCRSWTWVKAEREGPTGRCWLKNRVPEPAEDDCCVSGVKR